MPMPGLLEQSAPSDDSGDALFRQHREAAWAAHMPRYAKAVEAGNTTLAERIQDDVDAEAARRARLAAKRAPAAGRSSPETSRLAEIEQQLREMVGGSKPTESGPGYRKEAGGPLEVDIAPARLPRPDRAAVGEGPHGLPYLPPVAPPAPTAEMRSSLSPDVDTVMEGLGLPTAVGRPLDMAYRVGALGPQQVKTAQGAIGKAIDDPSLPNVTNAGVQTGMAAMRPTVALGSLGAGYAGALADDLGLFGTPPAEAQSLTRKQRRDLEIERQRAEREAKIERETADAKAKRDKQSAEDAQKRELAAEAARKDRDEYDRAVKVAEDRAAREMARDKRFSDTAVGRVYDETGGLAPALVGFAGAKLSRLATGPGEKLSGQIVKDYALPLTTGTVSGAITANLPLAYNALATEPDNPKRRMYEALAENLPAGHPKRQEATERLQDTKALPEANPIRTAASAEFYDPQKMQERLIMGGLEGFGGGLFGTDTVRALARGAKGLSERFLGSKSAPPTTWPAAGAVDGIPPGNVVSTRPTAGSVSSAGSPPALAGQERLADRLPQYRQATPPPAPEALPSRRAQSLPDPNYLAPHSTQLPPGRKFHSKPEPEPVKGHTYHENQTGFALQNDTTKQWVSPPNMLKKLSKKGKTDPDPAVEYLSKPGKLTKGM